MNRLVLPTRILRQRFALAAAVLLLVPALAATHLSPGMDHVGMGKAVAICLAVTETAAALVHLVAAPRVDRPLARLRLARPVAVPQPVTAVPARAGPADLQVFRR